MGKLKITGIGPSPLKKAGVEAVARAYLETDQDVEIVFAAMDDPRELGLMEQRGHEEAHGCLRMDGVRGYIITVRWTRFLRSLFGPGRKISRETQIMFALSTLLHEMRHIWQLEHWTEVAYDHVCAVLGDEYASYRYSKVELDAVRHECAHILRARRIYDQACGQKKCK